MKNKKNEYLKIIIPSENEAPEIYFKGKKVVGKGLNDLYLEQLNLNYLTNTNTEHGLNLSISGFKNNPNNPTFISQQFIATQHDLEETLDELNKED